MNIRTGIGQDSHRFKEQGGTCKIGGIAIEGVPGMEADSDGDVALHAICNAITTITHVPILGEVAIEMCEDGITDSAQYLEAALDTMGDWEIVHIALTIEGGRPRLQKHIDSIRRSIAKLCGIERDQVGLTVTSGDDLTDFARGEGLQCLALITAIA